MIDPNALPVLIIVAVGSVITLVLEKYWLMPRRRRLATAKVEVQPHSHAYRGVDPTPMGPVRVCPQCGAAARKCTKCGTVRTDRLEDEKHGPCGGTFLKGSSHFLNFTHRTSQVRLCSPQQRVRMGFLWLDECAAEDLHVHQACERCRWSGIARIVAAQRP